MNAVNEIYIISLVPYAFGTCVIPCCVRAQYSVKNESSEKCVQKLIFYIVTVPKAIKMVAM